MMISMFSSSFVGTNLAGLLIDRFGRVKILGISAITAGLRNETLDLLLKRPSFLPDPINTNLNGGAFDFDTIPCEI